MAKINSHMLSAKSLSFSYEKASVLKNVDLDVGGGELVGLIGPNGAGKSTLVKILAGVQETDQGNVSLDGISLNSWNRRDLSKRMAYLPQTNVAHWPVSVEHVVMLGRLPHLGSWRRASAQDHDAVQAAMKSVDVLHLADRNITTLSGGERARVLLARALAVEAATLLVDEPVAGLDPRHQIDVMDILKNRAGAGNSIVVVLHDLSLAARYCDRLVLLHKGQKIAEGKPEQVLREENLIQSYGIEAVRGYYEGKLYLIPWQQSDVKE